MVKVSLEKYFVGLSKDSLVYGLGNAVLRILALLTAPIFTRVFLPAQYGIISLIASVISFLSILLLLGMDNALFVSYYQFKNQRKQVISSAFWFLSLWGLLIIGIASFFSANFSHLIFKNLLYEKLFLIAFWTAYITLLINNAKTVLRLEFKAKLFAIISAMNAILSTGLMIFFVVGLKKGLTGYFLGQLIGTILTLFIALFLIRKKLKFKIHFRRLKEMLTFGIFILPAGLSFFVFDLSDRFFMNHYRTLEELGLYSIGINIAGLLVFFSYALGQAWSPIIMNIYYSSKKIFHQLVPRFFNYYLLFFFILAAIVSLFSPEILKILSTPKFYSASTVVGPLTIAMVFAASNQVTAMGITLSRQTKYFASCTICAAILNIILNFLLIPKYGMLGAAWSTASSYFFLTVCYYFFSQKFLPINLDLQKIIKLVLLSLVFIIFVPYSWRYHFGVNLIIKIFELGLLLGMYYLLGIIEKHELIYLKNYISKFYQLSKKVIKR